MGEFFDLINFVKISNVEDKDKLQDKRLDLRERKEYLEKQARINGVNVDIPSDYEFSKTYPVKRESRVSKILAHTGVGAVLGGILGGIVGMILDGLTGAALLSSLTFAVYGTMIGSLSGMVSSLDNPVREKQLNAYENHLNEIEQSLGLVKNQQRGQGAIQYRDDHAKRYEESKNRQREEMHLGIG